MDGVTFYMHKSSQVANCTGGYETSDRMEYIWSVRVDNVPVPTLTSVSQQANVFKIPARTLSGKRSTTVLQQNRCVIHFDYTFIVFHKLSFYSTIRLAVHCFIYIMKSSSFFCASGNSVRCDALCPRPIESFSCLSDRHGPRCPVSSCGPY